MEFHIQDMVFTFHGLDYQNLEISRFGTAALPFYVILTPEDELISTFPGMDTNKQKFIDFLTAWLKKFEKAN